MATYIATAKICLELDVEEGEDPEDVLVEELGDYLNHNGIANLFTIEEIKD